MTAYRTTRAGVILAAADVFGLAEFYERALDFEVEQRFEDPPFVILVKEGMRLSLTQDGTRGDDFPAFAFRTSADRDAQQCCLVLEVDDCDAAREALVRKQVSFRSETYRPPWGGARFFIEDPEGNVIEIEELA